MIVFFLAKAFKSSFDGLLVGNIFSSTYHGT